MPPAASTRRRASVRAAALGIAFVVLHVACAASAASAAGDPHFGLDLAGINSSVDSAAIVELSGGWINRHVYPLSLPGVGYGRWRPNTDYQVQLAESQGLEVVLTLHTALTTDDHSYFPVDTLAWKDSVRAVVERYDGDGTEDMPGLLRPVTCWHVEQEMYWWYSTWDEYALHLGLTRRAIKSADSTATVIAIGLNPGPLWPLAQRAGYVQEPIDLPCTESDLDRMEGSFATILGSGQYDAVDMHSYETRSILHGELAYVRSLMPAPARPVWSFEAGGAFETRTAGSTDTLNAEMVVRLYSEALANGVSRYTWLLYEFTSGEFDTDLWNAMPLTTGGSPIVTRRPSYYAYQQLAGLLGGFSSASDLTARTGSLESADLFHMRFVKLGVPIDILWCDRDTSLSLAVTGSSARVTYTVTEAGQTPASARVDYIPVTNGAARIPVGPCPVYVQPGDAVTAVPGEAVAASVPCRATPVPAREAVTLRWDGRAVAARSGGAGAARVAIVGVDGRRVRELRPGAGSDVLSATWDLRDAAGRRVPCGLYFGVVSNGGAQRAVARIVIAD